MAYKISRIVATCGTSIFGGANYFRKWTEDEGLLRFQPTFQNPLPPEGMNDAEALDALVKRLNKTNTRTIDITDPMRISAEYTAINSLEKAGRLAVSPTVSLIHTDNLGGRAAVELIRAMLKRDFDANTDLQEIHLNVDNPVELRYNLGDLMVKVADALRGFDRQSTCFTPLGGYKVMTSLGYLAGAYLGYPTFYAHEEKQVIHEIPAVPITVSSEELKRIAPVMKRIGSGIEKAGLEEATYQQAADHSWLFEFADDMVCVNSFGVFLMQEPQFAPIFQPEVFVSERVQSQFERQGERQFIVDQIGKLAGKLAAGSNEADLRHELVWKLSGKDLHIYKGASHRQFLFRCIYSFQDDKVRIFWMWTDHDDYEREIPNRLEAKVEATIDWSDRIRGRNA